MSKKLFNLLLLGYFLPFLSSAIPPLIYRDFNLKLANLNLQNQDPDDYSESIISIDFSTLTNISSTNFKTFDLEIKKEVIKTEDNLIERKIKWRYKKNEDNQWIDYKDEDIFWRHKGFWLGEMIDEFLNPNQTVFFKNLVIGETFRYDIEQPVAMLAQLFMLWWKLKPSEVFPKYTDPQFYSWRSAIFVPYALEPEIYNGNWIKLKNNRIKRHELNIEFFKEKEDKESQILKLCLGYICDSTILSKYDVVRLWNEEWIDYEQLVKTTLDIE